MNRRFNHFEIFKIVITTIYIASGVLMFSILVSNAVNTKKIVDEVICENCDELD